MSLSPMISGAEAILLDANIEIISISPGHNYFHHVVPEAGNHPACKVATVNCVAGRGLEGDRFFDYKDGYKGQITFFDLGVFDEISRILRISDKDPTVLRRNIFLRGADLNALIGQKFALQNVTFEGTQECSPCPWMEQAFGAGAHEFLKGRGGLRAKILTTGELHVGV